MAKGKRQAKADTAKTVKLAGQLVDVEEGRIYPGELEFRDGRIAEKRELAKAPDRFILPGLIDSHIHIESSMMPPSLFAEAALPHGTAAVVNDPHEIANVAGMTGIRYMTADAHDSPLRFYFTAPSCVPATRFETSGARLGPDEVAALLQRPDFVALGEMMNYPGVLHGDEEVLAKLKAARDTGKPIDGHCPGLFGKDLAKYHDAGISTDHESTTLEEAREKAGIGMKVQLRDGSASRDLDALWPLVNETECFLCSDDRHPGDLAAGHMDATLAKAVRLGAEPLRAVKAATIWPSMHYGLDTGRMGVGASADAVVVRDMRGFGVEEAWLGGVKVAENGQSLYRAHPLPFSPCMRLPDIGQGMFDTHAPKGVLRAIGVVPDSLLTLKTEVAHPGGDIASDPAHGTNLISVVSRYGNGSFAVALVRGFNLTRGAIGCTIAHDSHNLVVVGFDSPSMAKVAKALAGGGMAAFDGTRVEMLPLEVAGLMTETKPAEIEARMSGLETVARSLGCTLAHPFMTLSFMSLPVIPSLKLTDKGLFDVDTFSFVDETVKGKEEKEG